MLAEFLRNLLVTFLGISFVEVTLRLGGQASGMAEGELECQLGKFTYI